MTVVPTTLKRPKPCGRRYQYLASRPKPYARTPHGTWNRLTNLAFATAVTIALWDGLTNAGATVNITPVAVSRTRR